MQRLILFALIFGTLSSGASAQMLPIFGPKVYTQGNGPIEVVADTFQNCESAAQYELVVANGNADGSARVSSASVFLNGAQVFGPKDINRGVASATKRITVSTSNKLETMLGPSTGGSITTSVQCVSGCLSVQITSPAWTSALNVSAVNVGGTVSSSADEVGVTVNGMLAAVVNGQFQAPVVPLVLGANTLTATATNACLNQAKATGQVEASALSVLPITLTAAPTSGLAPLTVAFTANVSSVNTITSYAWDFNGDGVIESSGAGLSQVSSTYTQAGLYLATVTATDSKGNQFEGQVPIQVDSSAELGALLQKRWSSLTGALKSQSTNAALGLFDPSATQKYQTVFSELAAQLPQIVSSFGNVGLYSEFNGVAELITVRTQSGSEFVYFIYLEQDQNGLWKFMSM